MTRRSFVASTAVASASAATGNIRIAFIGTEHSHADGKMQAVRENPAYELVTGLSKAQILADPTITVVAVEGKIWENGPVAREALFANKHVHLEKPPVATLAEFKEIQAIAAKNKRIVQLGYMWRYNGAVNKAMQLAKSGELGDIYLIRATMNTLVNAEARRDWARFKGGQMFEQGSHLIDMAVRLMGKPASVNSILREHPSHKDGLKDNTVAILEWPGTIAILTAAVLQPNANAHRFFEVLGTKGTAIVRPIEPAKLMVDIGGKVTHQEFPYKRFVDDFIELADCVANNKPLSVTPEQDLWATEALLKACGQ